MIPDWWHSLVLVLAAYRLVRFIGWDDLAPIARLRAWVTGAEWIAMVGSSEPAAWRYRRPVLAHFIGCAFCVGAHISVIIYVAWLFAPTETLYAAAPLAISGAVGLIAKNWDA